MNVRPLLFCALILLASCTSIVPTEIEKKVSLSTITAADLPAQYLTDTTVLPYERFPKTEAVNIRKEERNGGFSMSDEIHLANADAAECDAVRSAVSVAKNDLYAMCIRRVATILNAPELCADLSTYERIECITRVGENRSNAEGCFLIGPEERDRKNESLRSACIARVIIKTPTEEGCAFLAQHADEASLYADTCLSNLAEKRPAIGTCADIGDERVKGQCITKVALAASDVRLCAEITHEQTKNNCISYISSLTGTCDGLQGDVQDTCLNSKARAANDSSYCARMNRILDENPGVPSQEDCYRSIVFATNDPATCSGVVDPTVRKTCYHQVGAFPSTFETCEMIAEYPLFKANCILNLAGRTKDRALCERIDPDIKDGSRNVREFCLQIV